MLVIKADSFWWGSRAKYLDGSYNDDDRMCGLIEEYDPFQFPNSGRREKW